MSFTATLPPFLHPELGPDLSPLGSPSFALPLAVSVCFSSHGPLSVHQMSPDFLPSGPCTSCAASLAHMPFPLGETVICIVPVLAPARLCLQEGVTSEWRGRGRPENRPQQSWQAHPRRGSCCPRSLGTHAVYAVSPSRLGSPRAGHSSGQPAMLLSPGPTELLGHGEQPYMAGEESKACPPCPSPEPCLGRTTGGQAGLLELWGGMGGDRGPGPQGPRAQHSELMVQDFQPKISL